jgi:hypothetical protein
MLRMVPPPRSGGRNREGWGARIADSVVLNVGVLGRGSLPILVAANALKRGETVVEGGIPPRHGEGGPRVARWAGSAATGNTPGMLVASSPGFESLMKSVEGV